MLDRHTGLYYNRLKRIEGDNGLRHLTFSCYHCLELFKNDAIKDAFARRIALSRAKFQFLLFAWVVMPTHVHILLAPMHGITGRKIVHNIKMPFAKRVIARWRRLNAPVLPRLYTSDGVAHFWQAGGGHDGNYVTGEERQEKVRYIHNNPVEDGLVKYPEDWAWSSARWYKGDRSGPVQLDA